MRSAQPQYVTLADHGLPGEPRVQNSIYAPAGVPHGGHPVHRAAPPQQEPQRQIYYGGQPQQVDVQPQQVLTQNGQTVYLNAGPASPYGYATVQYHPHQQQPQIIRQSVPGRGHPHEQYVSVVPINGGPAQLASIAGSSQTYAYWQPDGGGLAVPQVTIMNAGGPGGGPIAVARIGNPNMDSPHSNTNGYRENGRGKEKGGRKGRRDGGTPSRRGGEAKHSPHSTSSPLLEEFRATKSRDWTIRDIEGKWLFS